MKTFFKLIRIKQWIKNLFLFLPILFGGRLLSATGIWNVFLAFLCFCIASSAVYVLNDIVDAESDRKHPVKRNRPIAAGKVNIHLAGALAGLLAGTALCGARLLFPDTPGVCISIAIYLALNLLYSYWLKHIAIVDVIVIATGFVLRVLAGGFACDVSVSPWLIMMVFLLTLFIAFAKRRDDLLKISNGETVFRKSVDGYTLGFVDQTLSLLAGALIVSYAIYTLQPDVERRFNSGNVYLTTIFVIAGILRYMQTAIVRQDSGEPTEKAYTDPFLICCVLAWAASFIVIIYC